MSDFMFVAVFLTIISWERRCLDSIAEIPLARQGFEVSIRLGHDVKNGNSKMFLDVMLAVSLKIGRAHV